MPSFQSLYLHVPFCRAKCSYCAFYSLPLSSPDQRRAYLTRLESEFSTSRARCLPLRSIFIGGGTPSCLELDELTHLFDLIHRHFTLAPHCEWTFESNPESLTPAKIALLATAGVNRLSLGVQSFSPRHRQTIGRHGSLSCLPELLSVAASHQLRRYNLDLIYAIPGQTLSDWKDDLQQALALQPEHLSTYALTIEEGTKLAENTAPEDEEQFLGMWDLADLLLATAGMRRYEISNFALPGAECQHNLAIWRGGTYLGCGPAAASFDGHCRRTNVADLQAWLQKQPPEQEILAPADQAAEILAFGLRLTDGWQWRDFEQRTGFAAQALRGAALTRLIKAGLLLDTGDGVRPTRQGMLFNDDVIMELL